MFNNSEITTPAMILSSPSNILSYKESNISIRCSLNLTIKAPTNASASIEEKSAGYMTQKLPKVVLNHIKLKFNIQN